MKITVLKPTTAVGFIAAAVVAAAPASAAQPICHTAVSAKGKRWTYQGTGVGCKFMAASTQAFVAKKTPPEGWKCVRVRTRGTCNEKKGDAAFVFYVVPK